MIGWLVLIPLLLLRFVLAIAGLVLVPFTDAEKNPVYGNREDPIPPQWFKPDSKAWLRDYLWRAIRNPTNNLRYFFTEPSSFSFTGVENCDAAVRSGQQKEASRLIQEGLFVEFWYMRKCLDGDFFEFRIGWKFSGVPGFAPTIQLRKGR